MGSVLEEKQAELEDVKAAVAMARKAIAVRVGDVEVRRHLIALEHRQKELETQIAFIENGGGRLAVYYRR